MPVRAVHHAVVVRNRASAQWCRVRAALRAVPPARLPIPLLLPCEILLQIAEWLNPESVVAVVCCCKYMCGLYCEDGTFNTEQLWNHLLQRTFPCRHTGAPGPNGPPRLRSTNRLAVGVFSGEWTAYRRELLAVSPSPRASHAPRAFPLSAARIFTPLSPGRPRG